jgi:DNA polymerase elongation subunit (family B)
MPASVEEIRDYLEGYDEQKYIVGIESSYRDNKIHLIVHDPENGKSIEKHKLKPFLWMKSPDMTIFYGGDRRTLKSKMREYKIKFIPLSTEDENGENVSRLENGYKFLVQCRGTYGDLLNFFKEGGMGVYDEEHRNNFLAISPTEQFLIQTGKRLFKGMEEYNEVHRLSFDLETTGLDPHVCRIFQIGVKDNRGFQHVLSIDGDNDDDLDARESEAIVTFFKIINHLKPSIISGYNSENFDWYFFVVRCQKLGINIEKIAKTLGPIPFYRKKQTLKMGPEMEYYEQTHMWGYNIMDVYHAVRRAQAINSSIKQAGLKYITKYSNAAKPNRVYVQGDKIGKTYADKENDYWLNEENGEWGVIKDNILPKGTTKLKGCDIIERYLIDDLWETEKVDDIFNQATYLLSKVLPTSFMRSSTMGTAATWKLLMLGWYYRNGIAIPHTLDNRRFIGGLSRLLEVGYSQNVVKFDFASLYPSIQLTHDVFTDCDVMGAMRGLLQYNYDYRNKYKELKNDYAEKGDYEKSAYYDKKQLPLKILNNGMFGSISAPNVFPWGDTDMGEKITCTGRQYLRHMIRFFNSKGFKPLVGDTDGFNFSVPKDVDKYVYTSNGNHRFNKLGKTYKGMDAVVAEYNDKYMKGVMGLDVDEICQATINIARKNYADLIDGKVKLVGNSIKSKKMPTYIAEFIDNGIRLLLDGDGYGFVNEYYETVEMIYNQEIPLSKIANKARVRISVEDYKKKMKTTNKSGGAMAKQAHMELIISEGLNVDLGDTIYYVNTGTKKSHGDVQKINKPKKGWNDNQIQMYFSENDDYEEKKRFLLKNGWEMSWSDDNWVRKDSKNKEANTGIPTDMAYRQSLGESVVALNCKLIPNSVIENNPDATGEYNIDRYLDAFNKRVKPLLVCFDPSLRDDILVSNPSDRKYYTRQELELTSGQPFKEGDQDKLDELLTITDEELEFWNSIGVSPTYMFEDYGIEDEFSYDIKTQRTVVQ